MKRAELYFQTVLFALFGGAYALLFGLNRDAYDIFEGHIYQNFVFFGGGAPSPDFINVYNNPLRDAAQYFVYYLSGGRPVLATILWGALFGLMLFVMFRTLLLFFEEDKYFRASISIFLFISLQAVQNYAGALSSPVLPLAAVFFSLFVMLKYPGPGKNAEAVCGLLSGAAAGLDMTFLIFAAGQAAAFAYISKKKTRTSAIFILCAAAGFIAAYAPWFLFLDANGLALPQAPHFYLVRGAEGVWRSYFMLFPVLLPVAARLYAYKRKYKSARFSAGFDIFCIIASLIYVGYLIFFVLYGGKDQEVYNVVFFSVCAPLLVSAAMALGSRIGYVLLGIGCMWLFFHSPPVYYRRTAPPALTKIYYDGELEDGSAVIAGKKELSYLFPFLEGRRDISFFLQGNEMVWNSEIARVYKNIYFLAEGPRIEDLEEPRTPKKFGNFPANMKFTDCAYIITRSGWILGYYPVICRMERI